MRAESLLHCITASLLINTQPSTCQELCFNAYECMGNTINSINGVQGYGYKTLQGSSTSITQTGSSPYIRCNGAFSCQATSSINTVSPIFCDGSNSCANGTIYADTASRLPCRGPNSCFYATLQPNNTELHCHGAFSCFGATISHTPLIQAYGAYSLNYAKISSQNVAGNAMTLLMYGYHAGFGAQFDCLSGHTCTIKCTGTACHMLYVNCQGTCNILNDSTLTMEPIINIGDFDDTGYSFLYNPNIELYINQQCANQTNSIKYDNYNEHNGLSDIEINANTDGPICCRGRESCANVSRIDMNTSNYDADKHMIVCSGYGSCFTAGGTISNTNGPIFCSGYKACDESNIIANNNNVYCTGSSSCSGSVISAKNIYCSSYVPCANTNVTNTGDFSIYCIGYGGCWKTKIFCGHGHTCNIVCAARDSCEKTVAYCDGQCNINCDETEYFCPQVYSSSPTPAPTENPTFIPTFIPTYNPTFIPTFIPSSIPTSIPTFIPTYNPATIEPTNIPTFIPTYNPTFMPTFIPTYNPAIEPTNIPTFIPTYNPTTIPSITPTKYPTITPSKSPTNEPTTNPTHAPTNQPIAIPTHSPIIVPTITPLSDGIAIETTNSITEETDEGFSFEIEYMFIIIAVIVIVLVLIIVMTCCLTKLQKQNKTDSKQMETLTNTSPEPETINITRISNNNEISEKVLKTNKKLVNDKKQNNIMIELQNKQEKKQKPLISRMRSDSKDSVEDMFDSNTNNNNTTAGRRDSVEDMFEINTNNNTTTVGNSPSNQYNNNNNLYEKVTVEGQM